MGQKRKQSKVTLCKKASPARLEKALHLKSSLAKPPLYDQAYREKLATLSPGELLGVKKPSFLLFVQQVETLWKCRKVLLEPVF